MSPLVTVGHSATKTRHTRGQKVLHALPMVINMRSQNQECRNGGAMEDRDFPIQNIVGSEGHCTALHRWATSFCVRRSVTQTKLTRIVARSSVERSRRTDACLVAQATHRARPRSLRGATTTRAGVGGRANGRGRSVGRTFSLTQRDSVDEGERGYLEAGSAGRIPGIKAFLSAAFITNHCCMSKYTHYYL